MAGKMVALDVEETSGVDHPAHLDEGWIVVKQAEVAMPDKKDVTKADPPEGGGDSAVIDELKAKIADLEAENEALRAKLQGDQAPPPVEDMVKAAGEPVSKAFQELADRVQKAEASLKAADDERADRDARDFVATLKSITVDPALIRDLRNTPHGEAVETLLKSLDGQVDSAALFKELGSTGAEGDASSRWEAMAKAKVADGSSPTIQQARAAVALENPDLYIELKG